MYYFIVNPHSRTGKARKIWAELEAELKKRGTDYKVFFSEYSGHATELTKSICAFDHMRKQIVIVGGDGTANEVVNGLSDYDEIRLGYIPVGSGNDLARGLQIKADPLVALDRILTAAEVKLVDHGLLTLLDGSGQRVFDVSSGIGYDAEICYNALTSKLKKVLNKLHLGKFTYILLGIKQVVKNHPVTVEAIIDGKEKRVFPKTIFIASMIHRYEGGGLLMAPDADYSDRKLTVCFVSNMSKLKLLFSMPTIFFGKHTSLRGVEMRHLKSLELKAAEPMVIHTDGEFAGKKDHILLTCTTKQIAMFL